MSEMTNESDIVKEFDKLFYHELCADCWTYSCEQRDCCECLAYQDAFDEYKNECQKDGDNHVKKTKGL